MMPTSAPAAGRFAALAGLRDRPCGPLVAYPVFLMKVMCFALFASAFNLLLGFGGLLSFGHAAYFGTGRLRHAPYAAKTVGLVAGTCRPCRHQRGRRCSAWPSAWSRSAGKGSTSP